jgi:translation initiation factor 1
MSEPKILYSSDGSHLLLCKKCGFHPCRCPKAGELNPLLYTLKIRLEKNGRGGKLVTVVFELPDNDDYFKGLGQKLKSLCGSGGAYKDKMIEVQGDHREKIKKYLEKLGFKIKLAGG